MRVARWRAEAALAVLLVVVRASTTYAPGWTVTSVQLAGEPARMVSHRGSPMGGTVSLLTFPDLGLAIAAAANETNATGVNPFALQVAEAFTRHQNRLDNHIQVLY